MHIIIIPKEKGEDESLNWSSHGCMWDCWSSLVKEYDTHHLFLHKKPNLFCFFWWHYLYMYIYIYFSSLICLTIIHAYTHIYLLWWLHDNQRNVGSLWKPKYGSILYYTIAMLFIYVSSVLLPPFTKIGHSLLGTGFNVICNKWMLEWSLIFSYSVKLEFFLCGNSSKLDRWKRKRCPIIVVGGSIC